MRVFFYDEAIKKTLVLLKPYDSPKAENCHLCPGLDAGPGPRDAVARVDFISITEQIDTSSPMGKAMFTVISAIAEFERSLISERVRASIAKARVSGKRHGRPKLDERIIQEIQRLRSAGQSLHQIAKQLGISRPSRIMDCHGTPGHGRDDADPLGHDCLTTAEIALNLSPERESMRGCALRHE
jgi:hypothetical protein